MIVYHLQSKRRLYVTVISLLPFVGTMNCSAISLPRAATTMITNKNGCSNAFSGGVGVGVGVGVVGNSFLKTKSSVTGGAVITPIVNGNCNGNSSMHTTPMVNKITNGSNAMNGTLINGSTSSSSSSGMKIVQSKKPEIAAKIIKESNIICFDVDSTVITEEGIDELASFCGKGSEVARVTKEAMGGSMTFQEALKIRLNIIRPTQNQIRDFITTRPSTLSRNVKRFVEQLKADKKHVYLISGGFDCIIEPVAKELNIPMSNVFANKMIFNYNGDYDSFDTTQPTSKSGGKAEAITIIKQRYQSNNINKNNNNNNNNNKTENNYVPIITMIGDGATDLEATPPANYFIGFGGNVVRSEVYKRAQYYVTDFEQLM